MTTRVTTLTTAQFSPALPKLDPTPAPEALLGIMTTEHTDLPASYALAALANGDLLLGGDNGYLRRRTVGGVTTDLTGGMGQIQGLVVDAAERYAYISDRGGSRIWRYDLLSGTLIPLVTAGLDGPQGITLDGAGRYLYVIDNTGTITRVETASGRATAWATLPNRGGLGLAYDTRRSCLYASTGSFWGGSDVNKIWKVDVATRAVTTLAGTGERGYADGPGANAKFNDSWALGLGYRNKYLYVAGFGSNRVRRIDLDTLVVDTVAGTGAAGIADGPLGTGTLDAPLSCVIWKGVLRVLSNSNNGSNGGCRVRRVS